jgi:hypothetical protein
LKIKCLYGGCTKIFTNEEIQMMVNPEIWQKYKKFSNQKLRMTGNEMFMMNCPSPNCDEIVEIDPVGKKIFLTCENGHSFCSKCKNVGWHEEENCSQVIKYK